MLLKDSDAIKKLSFFKASIGCVKVVEFGFQDLLILLQTYQKLEAGNLVTSLNRYVQSNKSRY